MLTLLMLLACDSEKPGGASADTDAHHDTDDGTDDGTGDTAGDSDPGDTAGDTAVDTAPPPDEDGDGFDAESDCDDSDAAIFPGSHATEVPGDGVDVDCDGLDGCADLNCDGWADLVFANTTGDGRDYLVDSRIYFGGPEGYSEDNLLDLPTQGAIGVEAADLDGDGYQDLVFSNVSDGLRRDVDSYVYLGGPEGYSPERRVDLPTVGCADPTIADLDGDGWLDLVFANRFDGSSYEVDSAIYWGGEAGFSEDRRDLLPTVGASRSAAADLDGDGWLELVFSNFFTSYGYLYQGGEGGFSEEDRDLLPTSFSEGVTAADVDADGDLDLLFANWGSLTGVETDSVIYLGLGGGLYDSSETLVVPTSGATDSEVADLNGDGWPDMVWVNSLDNSFEPTVDSAVYYGSAEGFDLSSPALLPTVGASEVEVYDLDEDGSLDLVFSNYYSADDGPIVSVIYYGSEGGFDPEDRLELPTLSAGGVDVVGRGQRSKR
jgi:hypothetical protein